MLIDCPHCKSRTPMDPERAGRLTRCTSCGKSFTPSTGLAALAAGMTLSEFPILAIVALNCVTGGLYSIIHLCMMHDRLPPVRSDDPSGPKALGMCLLPLINVYWVFFVLHRLCGRLNEQRRMHGLSETAPARLAVLVALMTACALLTPWVKVFGFVVLGVLGFVLLPVFAALVQSSANELVRVRSAQSLAFQGGFARGTPALGG